MLHNARAVALGLVFLSFAISLGIKAQAVEGASSDYVFTCHAPSVKFALRKRMSLIQKNSAFGWQYYWGRLDFAVAADGAPWESIEVQIASRDDSRPDYRHLLVGLTSPDEAAALKAGFESGQIGFAAIETNEPISASFKARWSVYRKVPAAFSKLNIPSQILNCSRGG